MSSEAKRKLKNIICIYLFFILAGILILGVQKLKAYIEKVRFDREQKAYNFSSEGLLRYRLSKFLYAKLEFTNHKGEVFIIEDENDMKRIDADEEEYIAGKTDKFGSYRFIDVEYTQERIKNFNDNMKHIRISGENGAGIPIPPKTISEGEGMEEFEEIKNLEELVTYMHKLTKNGEYYLYALALVGLDGSGFSGRITYKSDNGEEKIIYEYGVLYLGDLFEKY